MDPHTIASNAALRRQFLSEIVYRDRVPPSEDEQQGDLEVLARSDGPLVVAWLWPGPFYVRDDPFEEVARYDEGMLEWARKQDPTDPFADAARLLDRRRVGPRRIIAERFRKVLDAVARAIQRSPEDIATHLHWSVPLTPATLDGLQRGSIPFALTDVAALCQALHLDLDVGFGLVDPQALAHRVDQSVLASAIADHLHRLTPEQLTVVGKHLPKGSPPEPRSGGREVFPAPAADGRYSSLYEALAADEREQPTYSFPEIDRILAAAEEKSLPPSARADRSWWAGSGTKPDGRPQVSAWWGAGYRIGHIDTDRSGQVKSVGFEALPGRDRWFADPARVARREYRAPDPTRVPLYPMDAQYLDNLRTALEPTMRALDAYMAKIDVRGAAAILKGLGEVADAARTQASEPSDPDMVALIAFLTEHDGADRAEITDYFREVQAEPLEAAWVTNLLTRARRQGWAVNTGTRKHPRWVAVDRTCPECGAHALEPFAKGQLHCTACDAVVPPTPKA
ncbi:hypothetical protein [Aquihabitans sp. McL0605]|uniref:hypothetical protein n=1 Tax=Aquihabitans sp. McL0605 TaxID=3415671 RepID=UPI003CE6B5B6